MSKITSLKDFTSKKERLADGEIKEYLKGFAVSVAKVAESGECHFKSAYQAICAGWNTWLENDITGDFWKNTVTPYFIDQGPWSESFGFLNGFNNEPKDIGRITLSPYRGYPPTAKGSMTRLFELAVRECKGPATLVQLFPFAMIIGFAERDCGFIEGWVSHRDDDSVTFEAINADTKMTITFNVAECRVTLGRFKEIYERKVRTGEAEPVEWSEFDDLTLKGE